MSTDLSLRRPDPARIEAAVRAIDPAFLHSPLVGNAALDERLGASLLLKVETLNPIRSFKGRGTDLFLAEAMGDGRRTPTAIVCASAGNFGQGLAYAGTRRGLTVTVFASRHASPLKIAAMRRFGAEVTLEGEDFDQAKAAARAHAERTGATFVEDGADPAIAEGAGTIARELTGAGAEIDVFLVPLGNGSLATGIGTWLKHERPGCAVIAVLAERAPAMLHSFRERRPVEGASADTIADGIAVRVPVPYALACMEGTIDDVVAVSEDALISAMRLAVETTGLVVEPAGVAGLAAVVADPERFRGQRVATVLCGGNVTPQQFSAWFCGPAPTSSA